MTIAGEDMDIRPMLDEFEYMMIANAPDLQLLERIRNMPAENDVGSIRDLPDLPSYRYLWPGALMSFFVSVESEPYSTGFVASQKFELLDISLYMPLCNGTRGFIGHAQLMDERFTRDIAREHYIFWDKITSFSILNINNFGHDSVELVIRMPLFGLSKIIMFRSQLRSFVN